MSGPRTNYNKLDGKTARSVFVRLCGYVLRYWYIFIPAIIMTLLSNQLNLLGPKYSGEAIDAIANPSGVQFGLVQTYVVKMLVCYILSAVLSYALAVLMLFMSLSGITTSILNSMGLEHKTLLYCVISGLLLLACVYLSGKHR